MPGPMPGPVCAPLKRRGCHAGTCPRNPRPGQHDLSDSLCSVPTNLLHHLLFSHASGQLTVVLIPDHSHVQ
jgi:hypothetical protein